jgi:hypothetical protein
VAHYLFNFVKRDAANEPALCEQEWDPPVPVDSVLSQLDSAAKAKADFDVGVVRITAHEYETAVAVAGRLAPSTG